MTKALIAVKAAVRMKILLNRLGPSEESSTPLLEDPDHTVSERLQYAKASLRPVSQHGSSRANSLMTRGSDDVAPAVNWFYQDMFAIRSLITASWLNLLAVSLMESFHGWLRS